MTTDTQLVDITQVLTWPQALVAVVVILAAVVWPSIATWLNSRSTRRDLDTVKEKVEVAAHEVRPNSGGSMADAVNRIESALTQHITEADRRDAERDARLSALESRRRWWIPRR
ncbi:hypothetical protein [Cellulosimicrobium cellulans]|uniref:hypothetical protein n=1 Tax=Cellulosimicrobium cellulans TaxID=1710 RepID=UPI001BAA3423|nr:hypothetical protein [Cellulosimicrobium cellulans]QUC01094.1 hypothetical protein J5A69_07970 [Cellulosimicrobium cellulans]